MPTTIINDVRAPSCRADVTERARTVLEPPVLLERDERAKWNDIVAARSVKEWQSGIDLHLACILAKAIAQLDRESALLDQEGCVLQGPRGGAVPNPRIAVVNSLRASILRYEARLHFDVENGNSADRKSAREAERKAAQRYQAADDDSLIQKLGQV